jgi:hypothetical protein
MESTRVMDAEFVMDLAGAESLLMKIFRYAEWLDACGDISFTRPGNIYKTKLPEDIKGVVLAKKFPEVGDMLPALKEAEGFSRRALGNIILINENTTDKHVSLPVSATYDTFVPLKVGNIVERGCDERQYVSTLNLPNLGEVCLKLAKICLDNNLISQDTYEENVGFVYRQIKF